MFFDIVARDERQPSAALDMHTVLDAAFCRLDCNVGDSLAANTGCGSVLNLCLPVPGNANPIEDIGDCSGCGSRCGRWLGYRHNPADLFGNLRVVRSYEAADVSAVDLHGSFANDAVARVTLGDSKAVSTDRSYQTYMVSTCGAVTDAVIRPVIDDRVADFRLVGIILNPDAALDSIITEATASTPSIRFSRRLK